MAEHSHNISCISCLVCFKHDELLRDDRICYSLKTEYFLLVVFFIARSEHLFIYDLFDTVSVSRAYLSQPLPVKAFTVHCVVNQNPDHLWFIVVGFVFCSV